MNEQTILLVEDNPGDEGLTLRSLKRSNIMNRVVVTRDGPDALDYLFARGAYAGRDATEEPQIVLLDLNLPKVNVLEVLRAIRADEKTRLLLVIILTSSKEDKDLIAGYASGANSYVVKPVDFNQFSEAVRQLGLYWLLINQQAPNAR
ncbi:MAG: two-component system response regulator [Acidobacteria bacterium]|nr:MAG: two-component system response regulator [Acidobacteriota bacterium]